MVSYLGKRDRAKGTKTFTLARPEDLDYQAGQFFYILIPPAPPASKWMEHHFSFSSSPTEPNVEFTTRMTGHEFKDRLDALAPGTEVRILGPDGALVLPPEVGKVAYVCGGIGITPARSMVRWDVDSGAGVDIVVLYANHDLAGAAFSDEFAALRSPRVRVVDVLSAPPPDWRGRTGHIDADTVREEVPDWRERVFYVSGPPPMVAALEQMLSAEVGVADDRLVTEVFPGYE
jgi:glycine betaine catabolism B